MNTTHASGSSWNDFNDAKQNSNIIPKGTLAKVRLTIRPGGYDDPAQGWTGGYATRGTTGSVYLSGEFTVLEAGAGSGRLCREVLRSDRGFSSAINYITVERSEALRQVQEVTLGKFSNVSIVADLPGSSTNGVIIANELLDNLAFDASSVS